jgi:crossover junction endodeoxyribonuclease RuvC
LSEQTRILGIDPGSQITGVGIIDILQDRNIILCYHGCIRTSRNATLADRLKQIYSGLAELIAKYKPDHVAVEDIFYSDNVKTAIVMGQARGVSLLAPINLGIPPAEYSPREVKLAVVGRGNASKEQVHFMVKTILRLKEDITPDDASDALAVAICHYHRLREKINLK